MTTKESLPKTFAQLLAIAQVFEAGVIAPLVSSPHLLHWSPEASISATIASIISVCLGVCVCVGY